MVVISCNKISHKRDNGLTKNSVRFPYTILTANKICREYIFCGRFFGSVRLEKRAGVGGFGWCGEVLAGGFGEGKLKI